MTIRVTPRSGISLNSSLLKGGIQSTLDKTGRLPPLAIAVTPLEKSSKVIYLDRFLTYQFQSSILIPVDTFNFTFAAPDLSPFYGLVKEGDIATLFANDVPMATGIIDTVEIETETQFGEKVTITGRDLMGQLEDQDAVNEKQEPIWGNNLTINQAMSALIKDTRVNGFKKQFVTDPSPALLFATEPGESKLSALQRYIEPLNAITFMDPNGTLIVGKPKFSQAPKGTLYLQREQARSNVVSMKVIYAASSIANIVVPIWSGQETVQNRIAKEGILYNAARGPQRLRKLGHRVPKSVVVSTPQGSGPQALNEVEKFKAGGGNILQSYAKREVARQNHKEIIVQAVVPGHYNEKGEPYQVDTIYHIEYDRGSVSEDMYLFQVDYSGGEGSGQRTALYFCRKYTIVADTPTPEASTTTAGSSLAGAGNLA